MGLKMLSPGVNHQVDTIVTVATPLGSKTSIAVPIDTDFVLLPEGVGFFATWELPPL